MNGKPKREPPWAVRGVTHETRAAAVKAARRRGQTLGGWLEQVIREAATKELKGEVPARPEAVLQELAELMKAQGEKLDRIEQDRRRPIWQKLAGARHGERP